MNGQYTVISSVYDAMCGRSEEQWAEYLDKILTEQGVKKGSLVLDCACGTATVTAKLAQMGYDMTGFDASAEMLSEAYENTAGLGVLLLLQDMTEFELYGSVAAALCSLDSVNYLSDSDKVKKFFSLVHNYLDPGGLFLFDVNTPYKFENTYGDRDYIIEDKDGRLLCWSCDYNTDDKRCRFAITVFSPEENGLWSREDEEQFEYCYSVDELSHILDQAGFEILGVKAELSDREPDEKTERVHFICKKRN